MFYVWYQKSCILVLFISHVCRSRQRRLTVVEGVSVLQSAQLLQASVQDPRPVTRHRQSQRLPVRSYRPRPLLAPVGGERERERKNSLVSSYMQ